MLIKKGFLIFAFFTICIIGCLYGVSPEWFFKTFLVGTDPPTLDQKHILRAVMMLYIALGLFWLWCAFSDKYRDAGIIVVGVFSAGLAIGRILSVVVDGRPSPLLFFYIFMELAIVPICIWLLRKI